MFRALLFSLLLALGAVFGVESSSAEPVRLPAAGYPAFAFETPAGWGLAYDTGTAMLTAADGSMELQLLMIADPAVDSTPTTHIGATAMKSVGAPPYSRTGPGEIADHAGDAFYSEQVSNGVHLIYKVVVAKLDASHAAVTVVLTSDNLLPAQTAALDALLASVRFQVQPVARDQLGTAVLGHLFAK